jgi:FemAB-related protein (PEP-CTERM system-associated)
MPKLRITELERVDEAAWDAYVHDSPASTFYHQIGWRNVVEKTYKHKPVYLIAKEEGEIKGVLPLFMMRSWFFGKKLVSVPFAPYGGVCADNETAERALVEAAKRITKAQGVDYLELRTISETNTSSLISKSLYVTSILELDPNPAVVLSEKLKRNKRKTIAKSEKRNLTLDWTNKTPDFYAMYAHNMRDLGSPVHSNEFFENILCELPDNSKVLTVKRDGNVLYAAFYLFYKDTVINSWSSTLDEYRKFYPTDFGIWNAIKYSCENGYRYYDFGRSQEDSTNLEFKRRWSAEMKPLYYLYYLNKAKDVPNITTSNPKRQKFAGMWCKLPLRLTTTAGPLIRKGIP